MDENTHNSFDFKYLKSLFDNLDASYKSQSNILGELNTNVAMMSVSLINIEKKNTEQDVILREHTEQIRNLERVHDSCRAATELRGVWHHIKRLNAYVDLAKEEKGIDTTKIDVHAQRLQHEKDKLLNNTGVIKVVSRVMPWLLVGIIVGSGLFGVLAYYVFSNLMQ